jgi:hypothetical protein
LLSGVSDVLKDSLSAETPRTDHAWRAVDVNRPVTLGGRNWDGETVFRTLADSTTTFHFASSQASSDSSFSPHAKAQRRQDEMLGK